ncbi:MAG: hypothetical protein A4E57_04308 [Syntrophorhabdaceae bacterium PtaU1.Bin034]|nr:MAG: hypothetical protein A4E57_04308 [Syntrophorhabdaceae bacterium PtaU1.Bin034]
MQIAREVESLDTTISQHEGRIISAETITDNLRTFGAVYGQLTQEEKYDLIHLLVKKIVFRGKAC